MAWKLIHRWLGLVLGTLALVLGLTGAFLAADPVLQAWQSPSADPGLPVATLIQRVEGTLPGIQEVRRLPSGTVVVYSSDNDQARAFRVDSANGAVLGPYQASVLPRWVKNLHRTLLLGDSGRWAAAATALGLLLLCVSGLTLLLRRMGGWRRVGGTVRGSPAQRLHVITGRIVLALLLLSSATALYMSATTLGLVTLEPQPDPEVASAVTHGQPDIRGSQIALLRQVTLKNLRTLSFPDATDPKDTWKLTTRQGQTWLDRHSGKPLASRPAGTAQRLYDGALMLHSGEGSWWLWAVLLGLGGASIPLFWLSGLLIWWRAGRNKLRPAGNEALVRADTLIFVASEGGSTWRFAQCLHDALRRAGRRVHCAPLEQFQAPATARQIFVLAATYGDGQPPSHASAALERIASLTPGSAAVSVLGFGDRQFASWCAYAEALDAVLRQRGWPGLLPLERIHRQSGQQFARWGQSLARALGEPLALEHSPQLPSTTTLRLIERQDYAGPQGQAAAILRFQRPAQRIRDRLRAGRLGHFAAGDLLGIVAPGSPVPRYYSLACGSADGFVEICVRHLEGGLCSTYLMSLVLGDEISAFIRANPGFALPSGKRPVLLIGAGTGVAPLAGFIRRNDHHAPMHLWFGTRDPHQDYYFGPEIARWREEGRVASVQTEFSRLPGGGYVQDALARDAERVRTLVSQGALVRVCGSRPMARSVTAVLDNILSTLCLDVQQLKANGRYAEDIF